MLEGILNQDSDNPVKVFIVEWDVDNGLMLIQAPEWSGAEPTLVDADDVVVFDVIPGSEES